MSTGSGGVSGRGAGRGASAETIFRGIFVLAFLSSVMISGYNRKRARDTSEAIPRRAEGRPAFLLRIAAGLTLFGSYVLYAMSPRRMAWSALDLPKPVRWAGAAMALACLPLFQWMFSSIGSNISETVLTKREHQLVTRGPYKWIRHPLYAFALLEFLSLAVLAGNWFMFGLMALATLAFRFVVIPREEANLVKAFGAEYVAYRGRTGALLPRLRGRVANGMRQQPGPMQARPY